MKKNTFQELIVSIHAPAWGATPEIGHIALGTTGFNPRSRVGSDYGRPLR